MKRCRRLRLIEMPAFVGHALDAAEHFLHLVGGLAKAGPRRDCRVKASCSSVHHSSDPATATQVMGSQAISRKLAIAGWAVAVIVGGFGLLAVIEAAVGTSSAVRPGPASRRVMNCRAGGRR